MCRVFQASRHAFEAVLDKQELTLVCYESAPERCHRKLLAELLEKFARKQGLKVDLDILMTFNVVNNTPVRHQKGLKPKTLTFRREREMLSFLAVDPVLDPQGERVLWDPHMKIAEANRKYEDVAGEKR